MRKPLTRVEICAGAGGQALGLALAGFTHVALVEYLSALTAENAQLAVALGNDYLVALDVVIYRDLYEDEEINAEQYIVDNEISRMSDIRKSNGGKPLLHTSVSANIPCGVTVRRIAVQKH